MAAVIVNCTCASEFQDSKYGKGKRVANQKGKGRPNGKVKCTICGKEHNDPTMK